MGIQEVKLSGGNKGQAVPLSPSANTHKEYLWMINKHGVKVPVPVVFVQDKLSRGFIHTDRMVYVDDPKAQVQPPEPAPEPSVVLADLAKVLKKDREEKEKPSIKKD